MPKFFLFIFLCCSSTLFAQRKRAYYFDENNQPISARQYRLYEEDTEEILDYMYLDFETDTGRVFVQVRRALHGDLHPDSLRLIRQDLEEAARVNIDSTHILVLNYYPGQDECNSSGTKDRRWIKTFHRAYLKKLYSLAPLDQFSVYSDTSGLDLYKGIIEWYPDLNGRLKNTFFKLHYPCASMVVIHPNGNYHAYLGEYSLEQVYYYVGIADSKSVGVLHPDSLRLLRNDLETAAQMKINPANYLVINYHPGAEACNEVPLIKAQHIKSNHEKYLKKLYSIAPVSQFNIYSRPVVAEQYKGIIKWIPDIHNRVRTLFFPTDYGCGSAVIICPDGRFRAVPGCYSSDQICRYMEELAGK